MLQNCWTSGEKCSIETAILMDGLPSKFSIPTVYAAAAKLLHLCQTLCNPRDTAHQAPLFLGFSRQEHWSGLTFPSPMHDSEK